MSEQLPSCPVCLWRHVPGEPTAEVTIERYTLQKLPGRYAHVATRSQYIVHWDGHQSDQGSVPLADVRRMARRLANGRPVVEAWKVAA
jgi:hypothetical protein